MILKLLFYYLYLLYWNNRSLNKIKSMQIKKFRKVFEFARDNSKFYHDLYAKHNLLNLEIKSYEDIEKVPIINKAVLREQKIENIMTCERNDNLDFHFTSGSSGEPFQLVSTKFENFTAHVRFIKILMQYGYTPFKKMAVISRYKEGHNFKIENASRINIFKRFSLFPKETISVFEPVELIIKKLEAQKPYVIWATQSILVSIAQELRNNNKNLRIPLIVSMSESISDSDLILFKEHLGLNLIDTYGCMEAPSMAYSYNSIEYKDFVTTSVFPEVVNKRTFNENKVGDIVITNLINKTMPIIRYDLGDFVEVLEEAKFPNKRIGRIHGRYDDILNFGKYSLAHHHSYQMFKDFRECEKYKIVQYPNGDVALRLKIAPEYTKVETERKAKEIWNKFYPDSDIKIEWIEKFEVDKHTGKFKVIEKLK